MAFFKAGNLLRMFGRNHHGAGVAARAEALQGNIRFIDTYSNTSCDGTDVSLHPTETENVSDHIDIPERAKYDHWERLIRESIRENSHL